jgi:hypothetical protein
MRWVVLNNRSRQMPNPVVNDILRVVAWTQQGPQAGLNVTGWKVTAVAGAALYAPAAIALATLHQNVYVPMQTSAAEFQGILLTVVSPVLSVTTLGPVTAIPGTAGTTPMSAQSSAIISKSTGLGGRKNRGRIYIPFLDESDSTDAYTITAGALTRLQAIATFFSTPHTIAAGGGNTITVVPILLNRTAPATSLLLAACTAKNQIATQRRRGAFGRPNVSPF